MTSVRTTVFLLLAFAGAAFAGCGGGSGSVPGTAANGRSMTASSPSPLQHAVTAVQENRTFNDFFATYPGADGTIVGKVEANPNCSPPIQKGTINLKKVPLLVPTDLDHRHLGYVTADDKGNMDGFDLVPNGVGVPECAYPYQYTDPSQIQPYWAMAQQYALAEHMYSTQGSDSFTAHQDLIRGGTVVEPNKAMIDLPNCSGNNCVWGCDAPPKTHTSLITKGNQWMHLKGQGPFPCSKNFTSQYPTLRDLLDAKSVSWKYYVPPMSKVFGKLMSAFDVVAAVRYGPEWATNVITPQTAIFGDLTSGNLPAVSWVIPDEPASDHPGTSTDTGPQWVASVVNAIGTSSYWNSTAIIIVWDDWGGLYDNLPPKVMDYGGLGFRVPAIVVSPYAKAGYISHTNYEFGSILRYVEDNWNLGTLGTSDQRATSIRDCFNYNQKPITFVPIASLLSKEYFIHQKPSYKPVDNDM